MRKWKAMFALSAASALTPAPAHAAPFGIFEGMSLDKLRVIKRLTSDFYEVAAPNPNESFESYDVMYTKSVGVCKIVAIGVTYDGDAFGSQVKSHFISLRNGLSEKYGQTSNDYDYLSSGSIWSDDKDFAMALKQNERILASFWSSGTRTMPDGINGIELEAKGLSSSQTWLTLTYEFDNFDKCKAAKDAANNSSL